AHAELAARALGHGLAVHRILAGPLAFLEAQGIFRQGARPQRAVFDREAAGRFAVGIELNAIAGNVVDLTMTDGDLAPAAGDAMRVLLFLEGAGEHVMDFAVFD